MLQFKTENQIKVEQKHRVMLRKLGGIVVV
jgi:hypothetical protein